MSFFSTLNEDGTYSINAVGLALIIAVMAVLLIIGSAHFTKVKKLNAKQLAFSAMALTIAVLLSNVKLFKLPMGGSVTLCSMLFVTMIGAWFGLGAGLTGAIAYGLLQLIIDPYIISFPQLIVDYLLAFGALGLSGLFYKKKNGILTGYLVGVAGRFAFSVLSGVIFFGMYAPEEFPNPFVYSAAYNGAYLAVEATITVAILMIPQAQSAIRHVGNFALGENA